MKLLICVLLMIIPGCITLGYETKLKTKCELMQKTNLDDKHGPEMKCGGVIETTWVKIK